MFRCRVALQSIVRHAVGDRVMAIFLDPWMKSLFHIFGGSTDVQLQVCGNISAISLNIHSF